MTVPRHWQHTSPVSTDECVATPPANRAPARTLPVGTRAKCTKCRKTIYVTRPDTGPESMRAMFRF